MWYLCTLIPASPITPLFIQRLKQIEASGDTSMTDRTASGECCGVKFSVAFFFLCVCAAKEQSFLLLFFLVFTWVAEIYTLCKFLLVRRRLILWHRSGSPSRRILYYRFFLLCLNHFYLYFPPFPYFVSVCYEIKSNYGQVTNYRV